MTRNVGFIGGGNISQVHADAVTGLDANVAAVADIDPGARERFAHDYGANSYEDYEEMLAVEDLDCAVVGVPNGLHADCAVAALENGVHAFVEKPLANDLANAERVQEAEAESDATVMVGFMEPFRPSIETARRKAESGELGDVYDVNVEYVRQRGIPQIGSWFTDKRMAGGGCVIDIGVHMLDMALYVLGLPDIETVSATTSANFGTKEEYTYLYMWGGEPDEQAEFDVEDHARALIRTADGATIHLDCSWASNREDSHRMQVLGSEEGVTLSPHDEAATHYGADSEADAVTETEYSYAEANPYESEWDYFLSVIEGEREHTRNTVSEGVAVQRAMEAIYDSAEKGREVVLD
jgi:predicted dehydrogenase